MWTSWYNLNLSCMKLAVVCYIIVQIIQEHM